MLGGEEPARKKQPTDSGRQGSQEGVLEGQKSKEAPGVLAGDSGSLQHRPVPEEH